MSAKIYAGRKGLSMREDAVRAAKSLLCSERLDLHPDYLSVAPLKKASMGVDEAQEIISKANSAPAIAKRCVILIDGLDKMTFQGQNKLLKTFEEGEAEILAVCYSDKVLPTIKSRCEVILYKPLTLIEFKKAVPEDASFYYRMTSGCPGLISEMKEHEGMFRDVERVIRIGEPTMLSGLISAWKLLKEKDSEAITGTPYMEAALNFMLSLFLEQYERSRKAVYHLLIKRLTKELPLMRKPTYTKDDFFLLIADLIEGGKNESL